MASQQRWCNQSSSTCDDKFFCEFNISRCEPCSLVCDKGRGTPKECCKNCPAMAEEYELECPQRSVTPSPTVKTQAASKVEPPTTKKPRKRQSKSRGRKKGKGHGRKVNLRNKTTTTIAVTEKSSKSLIEITKMQAMSSTGMSVMTGGSLSKGSTATSLVAPTEMSAVVSSSSTLLLLGIILAVVCIMAVCLLIVLYRTRRYKPRSAEDQYPQSMAIKQKGEIRNPLLPYYTQQPDVTMLSTPLKYGNLTGNVCTFDECGFDKAKEKSGPENIKVHGQDHVNPSTEYNPV